jgi:hypothetical protein
VGPAVESGKRNRLEERTLGGVGLFEGQHDVEKVPIDLVVESIDVES